MATPYYHYDLDLLERTLQEAVRCAGDTRIHFAIKANANPALLPYFKQYGIGIDCVSGNEVMAAVNAGFSPASIVFAGVGKSDKEIDIALEKGIFCMNVESAEELEVLEERAAKAGKCAGICLRVNPDVDAHTLDGITTGRAEDKFGIDLKMLDDIVRKAKDSKWLRLEGLHFHIGSQILDMGPFRLLCQRVNEIQEHLKQNGIVLPHLNVGGGLGVDYEEPEANPVPDFKAFFDTLHDGINLLPGQTLHVELGRSLVAQCGRLITRVLYVKKGLQKQFVITDAGMTDLIRPALYGAKHKIVNLSSNGKPCKYDVVGPICESTDTFGKDVVLPETKRGDLIAIMTAGAYGETMASRYNLRDLPGSKAVHSNLIDSEG